MTVHNTTVAIAHKWGKVRAIDQGPREMFEMATAADLQTVMSHLWQARYRRQARQPSLSEALAAEFYRRGYPERYRGTGDWITIGGSPQGEVRHAGGTPVKVDEQGKITAGPAGLEGRSMGRIDQNRQQPKGSASATEKHLAGLPQPLQPLMSRLHLDQQKHGDQDRIGSYGVPEAEGRRVWNWMRANLDQPTGAGQVSRAVFKGRPSLQFDSPAGRLTVAPPKRSGLPYLAEYSPQTTSPAAAGEQTQQTMFEGISPTPTSQRIPREPAQRAAQGRLFDEEAKDDKKPDPDRPPRDVKVLADGRWVGPATVDVGELSADPGRFQYKIEGISHEGVTEELKDVKKFNPEFGGQLLVWRDPEAGKNFVINGHHRYELAKRSPTHEAWGGELNVFYIDAKDEKQARAKGALANIAEGRGTAVDAANFLRESGRSVDDLAGVGVSLKGQVARDAGPLAGLNDHLFRLTVNGMLDQGRALAIGRELSDHRKQAELFNLITKKEETRKGRFTRDEIQTMAKRKARADTYSEQQTDLFGTETVEKDYFVEEAELETGLRGELQRVVNALTGLTRAGAKQAIEGHGAGTVGEAATEKAAGAKKIMDMFHVEMDSHLRGPLMSAVKRAAIEYANDPTGRKSKTKHVDRLVEEATGILQSLIEGGTGGDGEGREGDPGSTEAEWARRSGHSPDVKMMFAREYELRAVVLRYARAVHSGITGCPVQRYAGRWEEGKHPRGQPENAGQFGPGKMSRTVRSSDGVLALANGDPLPDHAPKRIPPAWIDVVVAQHPDADLLVKGTDKKGRSQSIYSTSHTTRQAAVKFARVNELREKEQAIYAEILQDTTSDNHSIRETASVLLLIQQIGIRPGSGTDTRAGKQAYGATTLEGRHVAATTGGVRLRFVGKKGVAQDVLVTNSVVAADLLGRKRASGDNGRLYDTDSSRVLAYSKSKDGGGFKPKDFRTARGISVAIEAMKNVAPPKNIREYKQAVKRVASKVSAQLGNTPVVALQSYIDPTVFSPWRIE